MLISNIEAEFIRSSELKFIVGLTFGNYRMYTNEILTNVSSLMGIMDLDIKELSYRVNINEQTLRLLFSSKDSNPRFKTIAKLNNFIGDVLLKISDNDA